MSLKDFFEQFNTILNQHLLLNHAVEQKVHNCQQGAHFLIRERILTAIVEIVTMEIKDELVNFIYFVSRLSLKSLQVENIIQCLPFISVGC